jgi:hypothetical protein
MASSDHRDRFVQLKDGPLLPAEPYLLALGLEQRGFRMTRHDGDVLDVQPHGRLTADDCVRIRKWKQHLLAIVDYTPPEVIQ